MSNLKVTWKDHIGHDIEKDFDESINRITNQLQERKKYNKVENIQGALGLIIEDLEHMEETVHI